MGVGLCRVREVLSGRPGNTNQVGVMVFLDVAPVTTGTRSQGKKCATSRKGGSGILNTCDSGCISCRSYIWTIIEI